MRSILRFIFIWLFIKLVATVLITAGSLSAAGYDAVGRVGRGIKALSATNGSLPALGYLLLGVLLSAFHALFSPAPVMLTKYERRAVRTN